MLAPNHGELCRFQRLDLAFSFDIATPYFYFILIAGVVGRGRSRIFGRAMFI